jgi:hypothetical protein
VDIFLNILIAIDRPAHRNKDFVIVLIRWIKSTVRLVEEYEQKLSVRLLKGQVPRFVSRAATPSLINTDAAKKRSPPNKNAFLQ